ncbi:hypothetical protein [Variovorax ginsengisoli]|uniref:Uncharacterized protein n=1 Tax=Variovorax ginsengisoli TaxID=363844 RepID=A0ABT8RZ23_9BURK|nr:hypothetical protein [Variovorax ginsengisoli]MDN8612757.1 hypothetical protein [Variovorax ginsengisoli]MDO1531927.1 hypothetical protein [Variovorax ginsengisoli]
MPYRLVPDTISHDTVECLEVLLEGAKAGEITGIAFACTMRKMRYITNTAGSCYKNPTFARGMVASLSDELALLVHRRGPQETR